MLYLGFTMGMVEMAETMPVSGVQRASRAGDAADLVVRNGRIFTGDSDAPSATCVAINGERIVCVGGEADVAPLMGPDTRVIDALGRRVIPGLNDSHLHVIRGGLHYLLELRWDGVPSLSIALAMLREQVRRTPAGQWVRVVGGWSKYQFKEQRMPTIAELNAAAPDTPVFVLHLYQSALLNRAAVEAVGYTKDTPDPPGGQIVRGHDGTPTGLLLAAPAAGILYSTLAKGPVLDASGQVASTRHFLRELNRFGLTSAIDAGGGFQSFPENYGAIMELAKRRELTLRVSYHLFPQVAGQELADLRRFTEMVSPREGDEWLRVNGAGENLAWSPADFENFAEPRPELNATAPSELEAAIRLLIGRGWGFRIHATYGETIDMDLNVIARIASDTGWPPQTSWFFDHAETVSSESLDRIQAFGGALSVQNRIMFQGQDFLNRYGKELTSVAPPITTMLNKGIVVAAGTDATRVSSYNPWLSLEWLVRRRDILNLALSPIEQCVDRETALKMYTHAGAQLTGEGDVKGLLKTGYFADLAILSDDFFTVEDEEISRIESVLTVVGGRVVYSAGPFESMAAPPDEITPAWSPVSLFGGFYDASISRGASQAMNVLDVTTESNEERAWRAARDAGSNDDHRLHNDQCL